MKKIVVVILTIVAFILLGLIGQADYEEEYYESNHTSQTRMPFWYE